MLKKFNEFYAKLIKESTESYDDARFMSRVNAEMSSNRRKMSNDILKKYPTKKVTKKCPSCGKETTYEEPDIKFSTTDNKGEWDWKTWQKGLSKEDKILHRTGKCYKCQRGETPAPTKHDEDPEV